MDWRMAGTARFLLGDYLEAQSAPQDSTGWTVVKDKGQLGQLVANNRIPSDSFSWKRGKQCEDWACCCACPNPPSRRSSRALRSPFEFPPRAPEAGSMFCSQTAPCDFSLIFIKFGVQQHPPPVCPSPPTPIGITRAAQSLNRKRSALALLKSSTAILPGRKEIPFQ